MDSRFITAALVGTVAGFVAGFLIYGLALAGYMEANMNQAIMVDPPNWLWLVISTLLWAVFFTYIFDKWAGISTWKTGASAGALIGFLVQAAIGTGFYSMTTLYTGGLVALIVDTVGTTLLFAITGAAIGFMLGRGSSD